MRKNKFAFQAIFAVFVIALRLLAPINASATAVEQKNTQAEVYFEAAMDALTLYTAPSLSFGNRSIALDARYYPHYDSGGDAQIIVDDIRGSKAGWRVELDLSDFASGTDTLVGATITFRSPAITSSMIPPPSPEPHLGGNSAVASVELTAGSGTPQILLTAPAGGGMARTTFTWSSTGSGPSEGYTSPQNTSLIELMVPGGAALAQAYTANLTWQLIDAP